MSYFIAALAAPVLGPVLYALLHERPSAVRAVDGFVYFAVPVLVAIQVLPHAISERDALLVVAVGAGVLLPMLVEKASSALERHTDNLALLAGLSGLALHAALEGAALGTEAAVEVTFGLAVVLHRIPVSLVIWWLIRPRFGFALAAAGVALLIASTAAGYLVGGGVFGAETHAVELYQAFVAGTLVHVVFHQGRHDHQHHEHG